MTNGLLPPNSTKLERALENVSARISNIPVPLANIWNADTCPLGVLPWLASALSVDDWDENWSEDMRRATVAAALEIQRHKGTVNAVMLALAAAGHPDATLIERSDCQYHNGQILHNGMYRRGGPSQWATFRVILNHPATPDLAAQVVRRIEHAKRLSCDLVEFKYTAST